MSTRQDKSLHDACAKGHLRKVQEILQKDSDIVNRLDQHIGFLGYTPLHEAACQDVILQLLLIYGGNVDVLANGNYTPSPRNFDKYSAAKNCRRYFEVRRQFGSNFFVTIN
jgi:ankyrin repeat protein